MSTTRILLVEPDPIIRADLAAELGERGYLVVGEAGDGQRGLELARELRPDLVISCVIMPGLDGLRLTEILTQQQIAPVLLCTALGDDETITRAGVAGAVGYVVKPWREADLRPAIELALARYGAARALAEQAVALEERLETRRVVEAARAWLVARDHLEPDQALRRIARFAMNNRKSMREAAEAILLAAESEAPDASDQQG